MTFTNIKYLFELILSALQKGKMINKQFAYSQQSNCNII